MTEYATLHNRPVIMGNGESCDGIRLEHATEVIPDANSSSPLPFLFETRFRFPFPAEDNQHPADYRTDRFTRSLRVDGAVTPTYVAHFKVQFSSVEGFVVMLPCPKGPDRIEGVDIRANGRGGELVIVGQRPLVNRDGDVVVATVARCSACDALFRYDTLADAAGLLDTLTALASAERAKVERGFFGSVEDADMYDAVAQRVREGYTNPPAWVVARAQVHLPAAA